MAKHCPEWEEILIEWSDGELPVAQGPVLAAHIKTCLGCQELLNRLHVSLAVTLGDWREQEELCAPTLVMANKSPERVQIKVSTWLAWSTVAVSIIACGLWFWRSSNRWPISPPISVEQLGNHVSGPALGADPEESSEMTIEEIEQQIQRQEHIAILQALNRLLADTPGTEAVQASNRELIARLSGG